MAKNFPCKLGSRHKWSFVKNVTVERQTLRTASFSLKGLYKCACGERKLGEHQREAGE